MKLFGVKFDILKYVPKPRPGLSTGASIPSHCNYIPVRCSYVYPRIVLLNSPYIIIKINSPNIHVCKKCHYSIVYIELFS
jgi:hypothetical protein